MLFRYSLLSSLFLLSTGTSAQSILDKFYSNKPKEQNTTTFIPVLYANPNIGLGFGAMMYKHFYLGDTLNTRPSTNRSYLSYTTMNQFIVNNKLTCYTKDNAYLIQSVIEYANWVEDIYQLGKNSPANSLTTVSSNYLNVNGVVDKRFKSILIGLSYTYNYRFNIHAADSNWARTKGLDNFSNLSLLGYGVQALIDTRDHRDAAQQGNYLLLQYQHFNQFAQPSSNYNELLIDARTYQPLFAWKNTVAAFRLFYEQVDGGGHVPIWNLPTSGLDNTSRGYKEGRYRDESYLSIESELRFPIYKRVRGAAFVGWHQVGEMGKLDGMLSSPGMKINAGVGIRVVLREQQRTMVRIDYGIGEHDNKGLYLSLSEAF